MAIFLVQHGKSFAKQADPNRSLTPEGREEIVRVSKQVAEAGITIATIFHSGKLRAQQTAELFSQQLKAGRIESIKGIDPLDEVEVFVNRFQWSENAMIVGHLPFMERLTSTLLIGQQEPTIVKFQNAAIICLEKNEHNHWQVKWTIMPVID
ncbi:MAG: phosphohistidine phosphatase SixA [Pseudomonadota bacterium]